MASLTTSGVILRFVFASLLVFLSYNPSGYSYAHWAITSFPSVTPLLAICGICLLIAWVIYLRATLRSLGILGLALSASLFACILWLLVDLGWLSLNNVPVLTWVVEILLSAMLTLGMCWSHVRRRLSGQVDADDVDEN